MIGDPFIPIELEYMPKIKSALTLKGVKKVLDLGSGDGRIVIAAAQAGADAYGCEINPDLVTLSRQKIAEAGVSAQIIEGDFMNINWGNYDILTLNLDPTPENKAAISTKWNAERRTGMRLLWVNGPSFEVFFQEYKTAWQ